MSPMHDGVACYWRDEIAVRGVLLSRILYRTFLVREGCKAKARNDIHVETLADDIHAKIVVHDPTQESFICYLSAIRVRERDKAQTIMRKEGNEARKPRDPTRMRYDL